MRPLSTQPTTWPPPVALTDQAQPKAQGFQLVFLPIWAFACLAGLAIATVAGRPLLGITVAALPTLVGVFANPTFALCCIAMMLPMGGALAYEGMITSDRIVGAMAAIGILAHRLLSGKGIRIKGSPLLPLFLVAAWAAASTLWSTYRLAALGSAFTLFQLSVWALAIWNALAYGCDHIWPLRSYAGGMLVVVARMFFTGSIYRMAQSSERFTVEATQAISPGNFAILVGAAFLVCVYLIVYDPTKWLRPLWVAGAFVLPAIMIQTGSRGPLIATVLAIAASALSLKSFWKSKAMLIGAALMIPLFAGGAYWSVHSGFVSEGAVDRIISSRKRGKSLAYRLYLMNVAVTRIMERPLTGVGAGNYYLVKTRESHAVHNDVLFLGEEMGLPAMFLYAWFLLNLIIRLRKTHTPQHKWLLRTLLLFFLISSSSHVQFYRKGLWFFTITPAAICYQIRSRREVQLGF